jgi:hypothetical protein
MAEDATEDPNSDPVGRPAAVPKPPIHSVVIEGEATEIREPPAESPPEEAAVAESPPEEPAVAESPPAPPPQPEPAAAPPAQARSSNWPFLPALLGALAGLAAALLVTWLYHPRSDQLRDLAARESALEAAASERSAAAKALETGVAKTADVQALDKRLAALETSSVKPDALLAAQADANAAREAATKALALAGQSSAGGEAPTPVAAPDPRVGKLEEDLTALSARVAAAPAPDPRIGKLQDELTALSARVAAGPAADPRIGKLESDLSALSARVADLTGLGDRTAKLEAALTAPKSEARVAAEISKEVDPASQAVAADALEQRLRAGEPFAAEWAALTRLGADAPSLAALKPYAETGAPTAAALAASFAKLAPALLAAVSPETGGGAMDKFMDHMRELVRVHRVDEVAGEEPDALVSQIQAALARGQVAAAMTIYARLPEAARKASADWAKTAEARVAADSAARTLQEAAISHLAATKD